MPSQDSVSGTQKLRRVASKILLKMKISTGKEDIDLEELGSTEIQAARFVTFTRPTMAPQIIDLKAMTQNHRAELPRIDAHQPRAQQSQANLNSHDFGLQKNPQQVFVFEATSEGSAPAVLAKVEDYTGYETLDDEDSDLDWSLLDLPEKVYARLANESRHSLISAGS